MQLRPFAPLAVIGAGLLVMSLATHSATAADGSAPTAVDVAVADDGLLVTWTAPSGADGLEDYDLVVAGPGGKQLLERSVDPTATQATVRLDSLSGVSDLTISVATEYGGGQRYTAQQVRVALPQGPAKPATAPAVQAEDGLLRVALPEAPDGVTGRVVQLYRDGVAWATVAVAAEKAVVVRRTSAGHRYAAAYQDVKETTAGALSEQSAVVSASDPAGPLAVDRVKAAATDAGLRIRWSAATSQGAGLAQYRVTVTQDGDRVGTAFTAGDVRSVVVPGAAEDGVYVVTVVAKDAAGGSSASTTAVTAKR